MQKRRKTVFFISPGVPIDSARSGCQRVLAEEMKDVFRLAQRNVVSTASIPRVSRLQRYL